MMATQQTTRERIEEAATRISGRAPQLKTIAKFINENSLEYRAEVEVVSAAPSRFGRDGRRKSQYNHSSSSRERTANKLVVWNTSGGNLVRAFEHDPTETMQTGTDVCRWVVHNIINRRCTKIYG